MKSIKTIILLILLTNSVQAWGLAPLWCPLNWYENYEKCPNIIIWKINSDKNSINLGWENKNFYILENNYFFDKSKLSEISEKIILKEWWLNFPELKKWDIIIYDARIFAIDENHSETNKEKEEYKTFIEWNFEINNSYGSYYKINCENNEVFLENRNENYDLIDGNNEKIDINNLKKELQTSILCSNFDETFWIKKDSSLFEKVINFIKYIFKP